mmetsp:Transcript_1489/g.1746  ORF Transcript_1489/g.1746 Transcript_1489/m.1746 type:complete len:81 (+) Transcript_1489:86-328(+)
MKSEEEKADTQLVEIASSCSLPNIEVILSSVKDETHSHMDLRTFEVAFNKQLSNSHRSMACKEKPWVMINISGIAARESP